jgi:hypothetical protein
MISKLEEMPKLQKPVIYCLSAAMQRSFSRESEYTLAQGAFLQDNYISKL